MSREKVLLGFGVFVVLLLLLLPLAAGYEGRKAIVKSAREMCVQAKVDRIDNADGWTAHSEYIGKVTAAASVKEDVKHAARKARRTYTRISASLSIRARVDCKKAHPAASWWP